VSHDGIDQGTAGRSRRLALLVMCAGYFLVLLDVTVINVTLPQIGNNLGRECVRVAVGGRRLRGLAPTTGVLIAARVVQGVDVALPLPGTLAIICRTFPESGEQPRAIGIWAGIGSVALPSWTAAGWSAGSGARLAIGLHHQRADRADRGGGSVHCCSHPSPGAAPRAVTADSDAVAGPRLGYAS
jgi:hypothetical protein